MSDISHLTPEEITTYASALMQYGAQVEQNKQKKVLLEQLGQHNAQIASLRAALTLAVNAMRMAHAQGFDLDFQSLGVGDGRAVDALKVQYATAQRTADEYQARNRELSNGLDETRAALQVAQTRIAALETDLRNTREALNVERRRVASPTASAPAPQPDPTQATPGAMLVPMPSQSAAGPVKSEATEPATPVIATTNGNYQYMQNRPFRPLRAELGSGAMFTIAYGNDMGDEVDGESEAPVKVLVLSLTDGDSKAALVMVCSDLASTIPGAVVPKPQQLHVLKAGRWKVDVLVRQASVGSKRILMLMLNYNASPVAAGAPPEQNEQVSDVTTAQQDSAEVVPVSVAPVPAPDKKPARPVRQAERPPAPAPKKPALASSALDDDADDVTEVDL